jgi:hypothetical protein
MLEGMKQVAAAGQHREHEDDGSDPMAGAAKLSSAQRWKGHFLLRGNEEDNAFVVCSQKNTPKTLLSAQNGFHMTFF